jgi:hypothetical protein
MSGSPKHGNESSGSIKGRKTVDNLSDRSKKGTGPR